MDMHLNPLRNWPWGKGLSNRQMRKLGLFDESESIPTEKPFRERTFPSTAFRNFLRPFSFTDVESRREFWAFALIGVPMAGAAIAALGLFAAILTISRALPNTSPIVEGDLPASDLERLVARTTEALHAFSAPFALLPGIVITAIIVVAALLQAWMLLSLVAATRRRLADAGADRSLALLWTVLPVATVLNIPGGLTLGLVLMGVVTLLSSSGGQPSTAVLLVLAALPVWLPVIFAFLLLVVPCLRGSRATVYARRPKLGWVLLVLFSPALVGLLISLPMWEPFGVSLQAAGANLQNITEQIFIWAVTWIVLPLLAPVVVLFGLAPGGVGARVTHQVGSHRRLTKQGYRTVKGYTKRT